MEPIPSVYPRKIENFPKWESAVTRWNPEPALLKRPSGLSLAGSIREAYASRRESRRRFIYQLDTEDYWQSPQEFENSLHGDCEDFAIWHMSDLLRRGYHSRQLEVHIGQIKGWLYHAVTYAELAKGYHLIIDNMLEHPVEDKLHRQLTLFKPLYALSLHGSRIFNERLHS